MNDYWDTTADEAVDNGIWILMAGNWAVKRHPSVPPGELVRRLRRGARITQTSAANEAGLQRTRVSEIERGHADPRWSEIAALLGAVGCAPVLLASGKGLDARDRPLAADLLTGPPGRSARLPLY